MILESSSTSPLRELKVGDPITIASPAPPTTKLPGSWNPPKLRWQFFQSVVTYVTADGEGFYVTKHHDMSRRAQRSPIPYSDEGVYWCCGHEGEAVDALKAACALR